MWSDNDAVLAEGRKYGSRTDFRLGSRGAYDAARERGLLDQLYPKLRNEWADDADVIAEGRKYSKRSEFGRGSFGAYKVALQRDLLDQLFPKLCTRWSSDAAIVAEAKKYQNRTEFHDAARSAYEQACKRKLLDLIDWPEENSPTDNDTIYIWRALGQHYNGHPVYKIGVTSARLGTTRVEQVAKDSGFEFDLICCEPVQCKATELERKLHLLGEDPQLTGFNGATEFRALSDSALYAAISMICNQL